AALGVRDDGRLTTLQHRHAGVGRAEIDADGLSHVSSERYLGVAYGQNLSGIIASLAPCPFLLESGVHGRPARPGVCPAARRALDRRAARLAGAGDLTTAGPPAARGRRAPDCAPRCLPARPPQLRPGAAPVRHALERRG